jgi:hypothetical protein
MFTCCKQNKGQNHSIKVATESFENLAQLKYVGLTPTKENCVHEEIVSRLNSGNVS